ncbi:TerD family protein [Streptomyces sp. ISL-96]|uniref:TerD family protein n=1 Tax=Streptomyces sp. ISL-96 TaxID=2819191 RepID=UPI001BE613A0|nr:TerD family protein [Streptomyces sp. ISL-96]MBT2493660.1 TerD family protein [Streptomyces sp. ISL-96]
MTHLIKGANTPVPSDLLRVAVCRQNVAGAPAVDASALLLDANGKVRGDADLVFYNQPQHPSGTARHLGTNEANGQLAEWLEIDLPRVEPEVQRVLIAGSCDGGVFGSVPGLYVQVLTGAGVPVTLYAVNDATTEAAFVIGEFYRRDGGWKFRAVGQGYASGLAGLATDFGIAVDGGEAAQAQPQDAVPAPLPTPAHAPAHAPAVQNAMPAPVRDRVPHTFGPQFPSFVRRGHGNDVVTVDAPIPPGPVIIEAWHEEDGYFCVETLDRRNKDDELVFNTTITTFRGRALIQNRPDRPLRLKIEADNDWTLMVQPLSVARDMTEGIRGFGPEVVVYHGPVADLDVEFAGDEDEGGYFGVSSCETADKFNDRSDLLVNETGRLRQTVPLTAGPLVITVEADGPWSLTPRALPVFDAAVARSTGVHQGRGATTVTLTNPNPGHPAVLDYTVQSDGSLFGYEVVILDEYDDEERFLRGNDNGEQGRTLLFRKGEAEVRLRIADAVDWNLRLIPPDQVPVLTGPVQSNGSEVFRYDGPPALLGIRRTTSDDHTLCARTVQAHGKTVISADTRGRRRPVVGPLWVMSGAAHCYVLVAAPGATGWQIEPMPAESAPAVGQSVSGQGYAVVRNTGPATEMMLTHESKGALDLPVVWALDERLEPVRRITTAPGLQTFPSGFLQIRTGGAWSLETR